MKAKVSDHLVIYFDKLQDWEVEKLIKVCQAYLNREFEKL